MGKEALKPLFLKIFHQDKLLKVQPFTEQQLSVGSGEGLSLKLEGLSSWHCLIEHKQEGYCVFDLESDSGTFINGRRIQTEVVLKSGDFISLGEYQLQFFTGVPPKENDVPPPLQKEIVAEPMEDEVVASTPSFKPLEEEKVSASTPSFKPLEEEKVSASPPRFEPLEEEKVSASPHKGKKFWNTFAPPSRVKNLDEYLEPSIGNLIEVIVAWKERILSVSHFSKSGDVYIGGSEDCDIVTPNLLGTKKYKLLSVKGGARIFLSNGVTGALIQGKNKSTRTVTELSGNQSLNIKPYEMIRVNLGEALKVHVRIRPRSQKPLLANLFDLKNSEWAVLFFSFFLTGIVVFYSALYAPAFLLDDVNFLEENIRVAKVTFDRTPKIPVDYKLGNKTQVAKIKGTLKKPKPRLIKKIQKKKSIPVKKTIKTKPRLIKKIQKKKSISVKKTIKTKPRRTKKVGGKAPGRKKVRAKSKVGSARPGGSLKTKKRGAPPKTVAPDPSKVGLLGVFGGGGQLKKLDKGASGVSGGGIVGLAESATGYAGTKESYSGKGIGTRTKDVASGGKGAALVGISGIKTKSRGSGLLEGKNRGGDLGTRGQVNIDVGADDFEVEGEIDRNAILRVIRKNRNKFDRCYQFSLQKSNSLQGHLKMQWKILSNGQGSDAQVALDKVGSSQLASCMGQVLESLRFPAPPSGQIPRISFKFIFSI